MNDALEIRLGSLRLDGALLGLVIAVTAMGAVMVASASMSIADRNLGEPWFYVYRHGGALLIGLFAAAVGLLVPTQLWFRTSSLLVIAAAAFLVLVIIPGVGHTVNGATRWLRIGPINLQVSELARVCLLIYIAGYAVRHQEEIRSSLSGLLKPMLLVVLFSSLLIAQPDFGAAVVLTATAMTVLFVAGARIRDFIALFLMAAVGLGVLAVSSPYRLARLTGFLDPWADPFNSGFQLTQSLIAIGRGDWFGVGLGGSVQKLFYLPEAHTDFVFAVLAEELGLVGSFFVVGLFLVLVWRVLSLSREANQVGLPFQSYLALALGVWLGLQAFINIGVNAGMLPTKGLTLPLMSYGRTSAIVTLASIGLLLRIYHEVRAAEDDSPGRKRRRVRR